MKRLIIATILILLGILYGILILTLIVTNVPIGVTVGFIMWCGCVILVTIILLNEFFKAKL